MKNIHKKIKKTDLRKKNKIVNQGIHKLIKILFLIIDLIMKYILLHQN